MAATRLKSSALRHIRLLIRCSVLRTEHETSLTAPLLLAQPNPRYRAHRQKWEKTANTSKCRQSRPQNVGTCSAPFWTSRNPNAPKLHDEKGLAQNIPDAKILRKSSNLVIETILSLSVDTLAGYGVNEVQTRRDEDQKQSLRQRYHEDSGQPMSWKFCHEPS